jgi:hypothetical protein
MKFISTYTKLWYKRFPTYNTLLTEEDRIGSSDRVRYLLPGVQTRLQRLKIEAGEGPRNHSGLARLYTGITNAQTAAL